MIQYSNSKMTTSRCAYILTEKVQTGLFAADNTGSSEVITPVEIKALPNLSQQKTCIWIEPFFSELFEYPTFDLQARFGNLH